MSDVRKAAGWGLILVPVDFSEHSRTALCWAADMASALGAGLHVLHVVHDPGDAPGYYSGARADGAVMRLTEAAEEMFESFLAGAKESAPKLAGVPLDHSMVVGLPANRIIEVCDKLGAKTIIMGSQGRTGLAKVLLGSKAQQVVGLAKVPVTIVKLGAFQCSEEEGA
jgi:nucleotide-binding universal stress UspA family protein